MQREKLVREGPLTVTPDTAWAVRGAVHEAKKRGFVLDVRVPVLPEWLPHQMTMLTAGRAVSFEAIFEEDTPKQEGIAQLWAIAVWLGFTPWDRNPIPSPTDSLFHYLGPWQTLYERLLGSGFGEEAWISACIAAQCDVGVWKGDREVERFVQAQLHRIGQNPGAVNGILEHLSLSALRACGLPPQVTDLFHVADLLKERKTGVVTSARERSTGHIVIPGRPIRVSSFGMVKTLPTNNGYTVAVDGPGRIVVDVGSDAT